MKFPKQVSCDAGYRHDEHIEEAIVNAIGPDDTKKQNKWEENLVRDF